MDREGKARIKYPLAQMLCKHEYEVFKKPIDSETNPYRFISLNRQTIKVCLKCSKRKL